MDERERATRRVYQVLFYVSLHFQDQCREVQNEAKDAKFRQSGNTLASVARIRAVSLSPEPVEDYLKPPCKKRKRPCLPPLSYLLGWVQWLSKAPEEWRAHLYPRAWPCAWRWWKVLQKQVPQVQSCLVSKKIPLWCQKQGNCIFRNSSLNKYVCSWSHWVLKISL